MINDQFVFYSKFGKVDIPYSDHSLELLNCMTLEGIKDKADNGQYRSTHELLMDFKWLQHNCEIMYKCNISAARKCIMIE